LQICHGGRSGWPAKRQIAGFSGAMALGIQAARVETCEVPTQDRFVLMFGEP
jgi:hypothetical protein